MKARWAAILALAWFWTPAEATAAQEREFTFARLRAPQEAPRVPVAPVEWGPFRVRLEAREARLTLHSHRLRLSPLPDGTHRFRATARVEGRGTLWAELAALGLSTEQSDEVTLLPQDQELTGRVRIARDAEVYRVTTVELPPRATVDVRSLLAERLVGWCEGNPLLSTLGTDCQAPRRVLSSLTLPLPEAGQTYEVRRDDLTPEERRSVDAYLAAAATGR